MNKLARKITNNMDIILFILGLIIVLLCGPLANGIYKTYCTLLHKECILLDPIHNPVATMMGVMMQLSFILFASALVVCIIKYINKKKR